MDRNVQNIPSELIYEMDNGTPIYYRGYKDFLNGSKQLDELMGSSFLQSDIITQLVILLGINLSKKFNAWIIRIVNRGTTGSKKRTPFHTSGHSNKMKNVLPR